MNCPSSHSQYIELKFKHSMIPRPHWLVTSVIYKEKYREIWQDQSGEGDETLDYLERMENTVHSRKNNSVLFHKVLCFLPEGVGDPLELMMEDCSKIQNTSLGCGGGG